MYLLTWSSSLSWRMIIWCRCMKHISFTWRLDSWCFSWICFSSTSHSMASLVRMAWKKKNLTLRGTTTQKEIKTCLQFAFVVRNSYQLWQVDLDASHWDVAEQDRDFRWANPETNAPCPHVVLPFRYDAFGTRPYAFLWVANQSLASAIGSPALSCHETTRKRTVVTKKSLFHSNKR